MSSTSELRIMRDRCGFPMFWTGRVWLHVLPVTWVQVEEWVSDLNRYDSTWYQEILSVAAANGSARASWRSFDERTRERIFAVGMLSSEVTAFAAWLGEGYRIPTIGEWREAAVAIQQVPTVLQLCLPGLEGECAKGVVQGMQAVQADAKIDPTLMRGGLFEWVRAEGPAPKHAFLGAGAPRREFFPNLFDPLGNGAAPISESRSPHWGFRLCRGAIPAGREQRGGR